MSMLVAFGHSDSIGYGAADDQTNPYAFGIFGRALVGNGSPSQFRAGFSACVSSTTQSNYNSQSRIRYWEKYADIVWDNEGTNDLQINGNLITASALLTLKRTGWTNSKAINPNVKLVSCLLGCRTTGPWTAEVGQIVTGVGWGIGGEAQLYNASLLAEVGTNINALIRRDYERGVLGDPTLWKASPVLTTDGLHPNSVASNVAGLDLSNVFKTFDPFLARSAINIGISAGI